MKKIFTIALCIAMMCGISNASFMYQEIDPICSISGTTHTSFPWEISDTSSWNIPKAYEWECDETEGLNPDDKKRIYTTVINYLDTRWYLEEKSWGYSVTSEWEKYLQDTFFTEVQEHISENRDNTRDIAILNNAVKMIGYDYFIQWSDSVDYLGLTELEAQALAEERGVQFRIGGKDGEIYGVTMDYVVGRITTIIENGVVIDYSIER